MTYQEIFNAYYTLYRAEATVPAITDDEYTIGLRLANEALSRWANYDNTYWKELYTTAQASSTGGVVTITTNTKTYACPTAFKEAGGSVRILDSNNKTVRTYPIVEPQEVQFMADDSMFAYFTSAASGIHTLHLNPAPDSSISGYKIDYDYYKTPTQYASGTSTSEIPNAYFIVHRMLGNRFRASRNPYYQSAISDAEEALKIMQLENNSGSWANPWKVADNSGSEWGR